MKKTTTRATIAIMLISQLCLAADRFQTIAMQGGNQTKVINVPANEVAQIVFSRYPVPKGWPTPPKVYHKLTINKGGISGTFTYIGNIAFREEPARPPITLGFLPGPEGIVSKVTGGGTTLPAVLGNEARVDHITGAGPIIVGPATMTFASTADANATHKAIHTIRFFPNPNIMGIKQ